MTKLPPAKALNGEKTGTTCDSCNKGIRTGDKAVAYATHYDGDGWIVRRVSCTDCGQTSIGLPTDGADEVVIEAVVWRNRLVGVTTVDRNRP